MGFTPSFRISRGGQAEGAPAFLAVAFAILVVGADNAFLGAPSPAGGPLAALAAVEAALAEERAWLLGEVALAWREAPARETAPEVRARFAAEAALAATLAHSPATASGVRVRVEDVQVAVKDGPFSALPGELCVGLSARLEAAHGQWAAHREFSEAACDPEMPRARAHLEALLVDEAQDPRSVVSVAVRAAFAEALGRSSRLRPEEVQSVLDHALLEAGVALGDALVARPTPTPAEAEPPPREEPPASAAPTREWLGDVDAGEFQAYVRRFAEPFGALAFARLLAQAPLLSEALLGAARALGKGDQAPLLAWLENLTGESRLARGLLSDASSILSSAVRAIDEAIQGASASYGPSLRRLQGEVPQAPPASQAGGPFRLRAQEAQLEGVALRGPSLAPGGPILPYITHALVRFDLDSEAAFEVAGRPLFVRHIQPMVVHVYVASAGRILEGALARGATSGAELPSGLDALLPFSRAIALLDGARREVDRRILTFKEAVSARLAEASATSLARVALRALEAASAGELHQAALALFAFLERFAADPLRDALTANFTVLGIAFKFVGDPVRQQASVEHAEGPHTFGARLRRVTREGDPLTGALGDPLSLTLEFYWRYERAPVTALLVLDPLMRSPDGIVRLDLRVEAGEGLALSLTAPRVIRRGAVLELSLSDIMPGGLPLALTPSGGLVRLDAGLRVEVGRTAPLSLLRFVLGAFGKALLDVLENQTGGEVRDQMRVEPLARRFFERLLLRAADTFAGDASRFVLKASAFVRVDGGAFGLPAGAAFEAALTVQGPVATWREAVSGAAALARAASSAAFAGRFGGVGLLDFVPDRVHSHVGLELKLSLKGGLGALPLLGPFLHPYPSAALEQTLFLSAGALASLALRRGVHWVTEYGFGLEGLRGLALPFPTGRLGPFDTLEAAHLRAESLAGPRVLISEALPSPRGDDPQLEFIELYNPNPAEVLLTGWSISDAGGRRFFFPDGTRLAPSGVLLVARSAVPFFNRFGATPDVTTLTLALNDEGDLLTLWNERGWASDSLGWGPFTPAGRAPAPDHALGRVRAQGPAAALPGSALRFTGSPTDFVDGSPSPGRLP